MQRIMKHFLFTQYMKRYEIFFLRRISDNYNNLTPFELFSVCKSKVCIKMANTKERTCF